MYSINFRLNVSFNTDVIFFYNGMIMIFMLKYTVGIKKKLSGSNPNTRIQLAYLKMNIVVENEKTSSFALVCFLDMI